ncbi:MAG: DNA-binding response regulator, partial [Bacteroidetes bacterium]
LMELLREAVPGKVKLNTRTGYILINTQEVVFCKADGNYTRIRLIHGNEELITQNLGTIEELLQPGGFFRASRSYLLNLKYLARVDRKNCSCMMEYGGTSVSIKIPPQKIKLLESSF